MKNKQLNIVSSPAHSSSEKKTTTLGFIGDLFLKNLRDTQQYFAVDPGVRNFCISNYETKTCVVFSFEKENVYADLASVLTAIVNCVVEQVSDLDRIHFVVEKQVNNRLFSNPNLRMESFLHGYLTRLSVDTCTSVTFVEPRQKTNYSLIHLNWTYKKLKTNKIKTAELDGNEKLKNLFASWNCINIAYNTGIISKKNRKFDDFLDCILLTFIYIDDFKKK